MLTAEKETSTFTGTGDQEQIRANERMWARAALARNRAYTTTNLRPPEREILAHHREALSERVLELGCGAGRLTGHLARVAASLHAIDVSTAMVDACRRRHPDVTVSHKDLREVSSFGADSFDAVVAPFNVLDVLGDAGRQQVLDDIRLVLSSYGYLVMSSHNLAAPPSPKIFGPARPRDAARMLHHLPRMMRNRRRLRRFERQAATTRSSTTSRMTTGRCTTTRRATPRRGN